MIVLVRVKGEILYVYAHVNKAFNAFRVFRYRFFGTIPHF